MGNHTVLVFFTRKPGASVEEFQDRFENHQIPLLKKTAGDGFPAKHTRVYLKRSTEGDCPAAIVYGEQSDFAFDGIVLMEFDDRANCDRFIERTHAQEQLENFQNDPLLPDRTKRRACLVSNICVTERDN